MRSKGSFTPSESGSVSERDQRTSDKNQRTNGKHQRKLAFASAFAFAWSEHSSRVYYTERIRKRKFSFNIAETVIKFPENPSESDVAFVFAFAQCI